VDPRLVYRSQDVVAAYKDADYLEAPERYLLNALEPALSRMSMLDIAVGAGRTSRYFAARVGRYVGIDFSDEMIRLCTERFGSDLPNATFMVADMRDLGCLQNERFDLVLISFNGISVLAHEERLKVFRAIRNLCQPGAYFLFSAHNLHCVPKLFGVLGLLAQLSLRRPKQSYSLLREWLLRRFVYCRVLSYKHWLSNGHQVLNDGAHGGRLLHYYVTPAEQVAQLTGTFEDVRVLRRNGEEFHVDGAAEPADDYWLFYLCRAAAVSSPATKESAATPVIADTRSARRASHGVAQPPVVAAQALPHN